ncbi:flagellar hook-basal body complex protein FliE [Proteocatella sphenisci]|uniref:flagellar hook-basal body complex protein FliE n=1 Tax=Proteocatella sphenisci TaxID=181070 RepID=UPI00048F082B|nr:flagellar hook-basal body complex protein FliE [Proteocatella sphenisci]
MFINQMQRINSISDLGQIAKPQNINQTPQDGVNANVFKDVFQNAVNNVEQTDAEVMNEQYLLATGQTDDIHNLTIASTKAQLSVDLMVQLRNRAMDSYSEIMRINI